MSNKESVTQLESYDLDHLGIVAGIIDEIGLVGTINKKLGTHPQEKISSGGVVKAMIMNGLGFVSAPLYLYEEFFSKKAVKELLGSDINPEHLNDDKLGKVLDKLYDANLTSLFIEIAMKMVRQYEIEMKSVHLDSSSFHVHGEYKGSKNEGSDKEKIEIVKGYSRDHRPDLKQFIVDLMCTKDGELPVFFRTASGNEGTVHIDAKMYVKDVSKRYWTVKRRFLFRDRF